jgi:hypothetical protein
MKPSDFYKAENIHASSSPYQLRHAMSEIDFNDLDTDEVEKEGRLLVWLVYGFCRDGRRTSNVWVARLDGEPFMVFRTGGRDDDEYTDRFITDFDAYTRAVAYLMSKMKKRPYEPEDVVGEDDDIEALDVWYNHQITPGKLGPLFHQRDYFCDFLLSYVRDVGWPYGEKGEKRKRTVWSRIRQEADELVKAFPDDPKASAIHRVIAEAARDKDRERGFRRVVFLVRQNFSPEHDFNKSEAYRDLDAYAALPNHWGDEHAH